MFSYLLQRSTFIHVHLTVIKEYGNPSVSVHIPDREARVYKPTGD